VRTVLTLAMTAALLCGAASAQTFGPDGLLLFDFEDTAALDNWQVRDLTSFALTDQWSSQGRHSAAITYHAWQQGKERWPAVIATKQRGTLTATDFTPYEVLQCDAFNPQPFPVVVKIHLRDATGKRAQQSFSLPPGQKTVISEKVAYIGNTLNARDVTELHFYVTEPERTYTVYIDNVRLTIDALSPALELLPKVHRLEKTILSMQPGTIEAPSLGLADKIVSIRTVRGQTERLIQSLQAGHQTWQELQRAARRVKRLEAHYTALNGIAPVLHGLEYARKTGAGKFILATESPMQKVFLQTGRFASPFADSYALSAARNEHESFQAIVFPVSEALHEVTWELSPITNANGDAIPATVRMVGYVDTKKPSYPVEFTGWWPDPLLDFMDSAKEVPVGEVLPLWVTVDVPDDAAAGLYRGKLTVQASNASARAMDITLEVWDFALPKNTHLRTALSWRGHLPQLYPEDQADAMTAKYHEWMLEEYHLNPNNIYGGPPNWGVERLKQLKALGLNAINLAYFNAPREPDFNADSYWRSFEDRVKKIRAYLPTVDAAGVRDLCFIYCFDERPAAQLDVVFETAQKLHQIWPDIPVMTTAYDQTFGLERDNGHHMDIWVPLTPHFDGNAERLAQARDQGRDIWWYICIGPRHPYANWFVEWPAIEGRLLMGAMTARYEPGGFLYYAVNRWPLNKKVITDGPRTDWNPASYKINNGDGSIMCAGPNGPLATIRLENIRDGIEDYEYYLLLRDLLKARGLGPQTGAVPAQVVEDLSHFTYDPAVVLAERQRVANMILRLQP